MNTETGVNFESRKSTPSEEEKDTSTVGILKFLLKYMLTGELPPDFKESGFLGLVNEARFDRPVESGNRRPLMAIVHDMDRYIEEHHLPPDSKEAHVASFYRWAATPYQSKITVPSQQSTT